MKTDKKSGALMGAAFIMATSAIGPGFLTQSAQFTSDLQGSFGFVILISVLLAAVVQMNVWRVLCGSGLRGQEVANKLLPGLGYFVAALVVIGGLVFNIGNVGGGALGFNTLLGIPENMGYILSGSMAIVIFLLKDALKAMDTLSKILSGVMILVIFVVIIIVKPPVGLAMREMVMPSTKLDDLFLPILTLLGGTVGGYITFAGAHRLIDGGISGTEHMKEITKSSVLGISIAALVRVLLFLAILGVVVTGVTLDTGNPAADAFRQGAGEIGYRFFGLVLLCAATTSIIGAAYTSVSFLKTFSPVIQKNEKIITIGFIAVSTLVMFLIGKPAQLMIFAGALNGLILPVTLGICLVASQKKSIMGENYKHPKVLFILGILVVIATGVLGLKLGIENLGSMFM